MRSIALMLFIWLGLSAWYVMDSYGMERGAIVRVPMLKGGVTVRTLAGYLSIYYTHSNRRNAASFEWRPFGWEASHNWGGGLYVHLRRRHHPTHPNEYSEIRMPLIVPMLSVPLLLLIAGYRNYRAFRRRKA